METNVRGLLRTLQLNNNHGLMPLYEAISNATDAIREVSPHPAPRINIQFSRLNDLVSQDEDQLQPIDGFRIEDNGIGFTNEHLAAFQKAYTDKKLHIGGKGVGRFTYLKVFDSVEINSTYLANDLRETRRFSFSIDKEVELLNPGTALVTTGTALTVFGLNQAFQKSWPSEVETIGKKIITHFLIGFASQNMPPIFLHDTNGEAYNLQTLFQEFILPHLQEYDLQIDQHHFHIQILRHSTNRETHELMFCAHGREVANTKLKNLLPELPERLLDGNGQAFALKILVSGEYFDSNLNETRTEILFNPDQEDVLVEEKKITRAELNKNLAIHLREILKLDLEITNKEKIENVISFVERIAPEYQILLNEKYRGRLEKLIPPDCTDEKLDEYLLHIKRNIEDEVKKEEKEITRIIDEGSYNDYKDKVNELFEKLNDVGKANLAKYVTHRRAVLDLLEHSLQRKKSDSKYPLEEVIHKMIFPMRVGSKDIFLEQQNLWVIDERLGYHTLLISDKKLNSVRGLENTSGKEPDLLGVFFDSPTVVSEAMENSGAVVVIEFKRPGRDDYLNDPTQQLTDRFVEIGEGGVEDIDGRLVNPRNLRYFGYFIADLTPSLRRHVKMSYTESIDGEGFFRTLPNGSGYVEIISYNKLITDAKRRNRILFDKLGLHKN